MAETLKSVDSLVQDALEGYSRFGIDDSPTIFCCAPGRVNLIGGHVDYNDGFVLPMALPMVTVCVGGPLASDAKEFSEKTCLVTTSSSTDCIESHKVERIQLPILKEAFSEDRTKVWTDYIAAVMHSFKGNIKPFALSIATSVPLGGGLSSSAALEISMYSFLELLSGGECTKSIEKAIACQKSEHLVGVPCGIMDQLISVMGKEGNLLLVDCRSLSLEQIRLQDKNVGVLITNSNVKHKLSESEYPIRRKMCEDAATLMGVESLRDANLELLNKNKSNMAETMYKCALHVVTEISRTLEAVEALKKNDHRKFGGLITESHVSLRDNFKVSCQELDQLVKIVCKIDGVFGSRLVGGGFGGCTITWLSLDKISQTIEAIKNHYDGNATFYVCQPSEGVRMLSN